MRFRFHKSGDKSRFNRKHTSNQSRW